MSLTVYYVCKKPSRRRLSITTGTRDKIYVLPPYFYLYLAIKTSLGSNKPSPVTGLAVFPYYSFQENHSGGIIFQKSCRFTPPTGSLRRFFAGKIAPSLYLRGLFSYYNCIVLYQHGQARVNYGIFNKFAGSAISIYMLFTYNRYIRASRPISGFLTWLW